MRTVQANRHKPRMAMTNRIAHGFLSDAIEVGCDAVFSEIYADLAVERTFDPELCGGAFAKFLEGARQTFGVDVCQQ